MIVGRHTYGHESITVPGNAHGFELTIGSYCSIAANVTVLLGGEHRTDYVSTFPFHERLSFPVAESGWSKGHVRIGSDVWIGYGVLILSGVSIGHGAVIGAGAVVTRDVYPYDIVGGNPAHVIRARFQPQVVAALLRLKWWDWPDDKIHRLASVLASTDVAALLAE